MTAGRSCPLSYRYAPSDLHTAAELQTDTLYVVGGLYGNTAALETVVSLFAREQGRKHLLFNGDFNWFNISPENFKRVNETVLAFDAIRGNVETELAYSDISDSEAGAEAGCGCAYPDWVEQAVVERSNTIMQRLMETAADFPTLREQLAALPMWKRIDVSGIPIGIVHGDAESLAGWGFAPEHLKAPAYRQQAARWFDASGLRIFACSHTCSPALCSVINTKGESCWIANNGAAGMPNFSQSQYGLLTRIAITPYTAGPVCYGTQLDSLFIDALPITYDVGRWHGEFLAQWPADSAAHDSYWQRICNGPAFTIEQAFQSLIRA